MRIRIGIVGDYNPAFHTHPIIAEAFEHAAARLGADVAAAWVPTESVTPQNAAALLAGFDGLWLAPGSPYRSMEGALEAARFARERNWPFTGS